MLTKPIDPLIIARNERRLAEPSRYEFTNLRQIRSLLAHLGDVGRYLSKGSGAEVRPFGLEMLVGWDHLGAYNVYSDRLQTGTRGMSAVSFCQPSWGNVVGDHRHKYPSQES